MCRRRYSTLITALLLTLLGWGQGTAGDSQGIVKAPINSLMDAETCSGDGCHNRIYGEWHGSMHASANPEKDPLVGAFYEYLDDKDISTAMCDNCHSPMKAIYGSDLGEDEPGALREGITCIFCHSIYGVHDPEGHGKNHYSLDFTASGTGPGTDVTKNVHDAEGVKMFRSVDLCGGCHRQGETDFIITENRKIICQQCHMPVKRNKKAADLADKRKKVYRHLFEGGHSELLLSMAVTLVGQVEVGEKYTEFELVISNDAYHTIPTGFPLRAIYLKVQAFNEDDEVIWENYKEDPYGEDPKSYFGLRYKPEEAILAHYAKPVQPVSGHLIAAKMPHTVDYKVESDKVAYFGVKAYYRLLSQDVMKMLNLTDELVPEMLMTEDVFYPH